MTRQELISNISKMEPLFDEKYLEKFTTEELKQGLERVRIFSPDKDSTGEKILWTDKDIELYTAVQKHNLDQTPLASKEDNLPYQDKLDYDSLLLSVTTFIGTIRESGLFPVNLSKKKEENIKKYLTRALIPERIRTRPIKGKE